MKIKVSWEASVSQGVEVFTLEELDCSSEEEWNALSEEEKNERLQEALDSLPTRTYPMVSGEYILK